MAPLAPKTGDAVFAAVERVNAELFTLTYGAIVRQLLTDLEEVDEVNKQLDQMGYNIGIRLIDEFLAKSNISRCVDFKDTAEVIAKIYLQGATITSWRKKPEGENLIYVSEQSFSKGQKMRGGVTIYFPKFDEEMPTESSNPLGMQVWSLLEEGNNFLKLGVTFENWEAFLRVSLDEKGNLQLKSTIRNISRDNLDFKVAAYCYLRVKEVRKVKISGLYGLEYLNFINSKMHTDQKRPLCFEKEVRRLYSIPPQQEILMDSLEDSRELFCSSSTERTYLNHTEKLNTPDFLVWGNGAFAPNRMNGLKKKDRQRFLFIAFGHMKETSSLEFLQQQTLSLRLTSEEHVPDASLEGFF